jgi:hypothetical protein
MVIIKSKEILDLISLFEDAYGSSHSLLETKIQEKGDVRLA